MSERVRRWRNAIIVAVSALALGEVLKWFFRETIKEIIFGSLGDFLRGLVGQVSATYILTYLSLGLPYALALGIVSLVALWFYDQGKTVTALPQKPIANVVGISNREQKKMSLALLGMVVFGLGFVVSAIAYFSPEPVPVERPKGTDPRDLEFTDWLFREFPNANALGVTQIEQGQFVNKKFAEFIIVQPTNIRAEFYVVYIPEDANAYAVSEYVLNNYRALRDRQAPRRPVEHKFGDKIPTIGEQLAFTGQMFIYHEAPLSEEQQKTLWQQFKEKEIMVEFRGPEYIAEKKAFYAPRTHKD